MGGYVIAVTTKDAFMEERHFMMSLELSIIMLNANLICAKNAQYHSECDNLIDLFHH